MSLIHSSLKPDGELHIDDYRLQRASLMRTLFQRSVQANDGIEDAQPNADGMMLKLIEEAGLDQLQKLEFIRAVAGSISLDVARA